MNRTFSHTDKSELPTWTDKDVDYTLIAGKGYGKESPVPVYSDLFMLQLVSKKKINFLGKRKLRW